jgi:hypothetical protein
MILEIHIHSWGPFEISHWKGCLNVEFVSLMFHAENYRNPFFELNGTFRWELVPL